MLSFWNSIFSNFYPVNFTFKSLYFISSEQAFMWCKARHFGDVPSCIAILDAKDPKSAKTLGRAVKGFDNAEWDKVRYGYMVEVLKAKFNSHPFILSPLLSTTGLELIEGSPYDKIWGVGIHWQNDACFDKTKWQGQNLLGQALVEVREYLLDNTFYNYACYTNHHTKQLEVMEGAEGDKYYHISVRNWNSLLDHVSLVSKEKDVNVSDIIIHMFKNNLKEHLGFKEGDKRNGSKT